MSAVIGFSKAATAIAILGLSFALMGAASPPAAPTSSVTIFNPGNADLTGYAIAVQPDGEAWTIDATGRGQGQLPSSLTQVFFADLAAAGPLAQLAARPCTEPGSTSAQLGIFLSWHGQHSPNLQCTTDPRADRLLADAQAIAHALYIQPLRSRPVVLNYGRGGAADSYHAYAPARSTGSYGAAAASNYRGGSYGGASYGGGSYTGGNYGNAGVTNYTSSYGGAYTGGYGNNSLGVGSGAGGSYGLSGNSSFASTMQFDTSFFTNGVFGNNNSLSTNGSFGKSSTFGSGNAYGSLPTSSLPTGSLGSGLTTTGLPTNSTVTSSTPH